MSYSNLRSLLVSRRPLVWLNILCLDAPIIAISWQWLFARVFGVPVPLVEREALFVTAWVIYLGDRLSDSVFLPADVPKSVRQEFCRRHKNIWIGLIAVSASLDAAIVFTSVESSTFVRGIFLGVIAAVYLVINHAISKLWETIPLKEVIIGSLFAAGTLLALMPRLSRPSWTMALAAFLFVGLCTLNCASIAAWECDLDRAQGKHSIATRWSRTRLYAPVASFILAGASGVLILFHWSLWPMSVCLGISAILLGAVGFSSIDRDERAALADLVLLTPLALVFTVRIL